MTGARVILNAVKDPPGDSSADLRMTGARVILNAVKDPRGFFGRTLRMTGADLGQRANFLTLVFDLRNDAGCVVGNIKGAIRTNCHVDRCGEARGESAVAAIGQETHYAFGEIHGRP